MMQKISKTLVKLQLTPYTFPQLSYRRFGEYSQVIVLQ